MLLPFLSPPFANIFGLTASRDLHTVLSRSIERKTSSTNLNALTISSDITTTGLIDINAPITLGADVILSSGTGAGDIELGSSVLGAHNLDISSGSGAVTITGDVGAEASKALTSLDINNGSETGNVTLTGNIGTASLTGAGAVNIGNNGLTGTITFGGTDYSTCLLYTSDAADE